MDENEFKIRKRLHDDLEHYALKCLKIRTKSGSIIPFTFNKAQKYIHERLEQQLKETGKVRALILKSRQQGSSTYIGARLYHKATYNKGHQAFILTHSLEATNNLFKMAKRFYEHTPLAVRPEVSTSNAKELIFGALDSGYKLGTAENKNVGRSSTIQLAHLCLAKGSFIYNPDNGGIKRIEDFSLGDRVLTHTGAIAPISYISSQTKECIKVLFRGVPRSPLVATPEHKVWTQSGWRMLGDLKPGDSIGYPISNIEKNINSLSIPAATVRKHGGGRQFICPDYIEIDYSFGRIIGIYLAEGHLKLQAKEPKLPSCVSFAVHRKEVERTVEWLSPFKKYFSSINVVDRKGCLTSEVIIYGSRFAALINELCGRVETKHFPMQWREMGDDFCRGMIHGYVSGDGHSAKNTRMVAVTSIRSALSITCRDIIASLGYGWSSITYAPGAIRHGRNEKDQYILHLCSDGATQLAKEIDKIYFERKLDSVNSFVENAPTVTQIKNGYAWLRIRTIESAGMLDVYDFEVDHPDHSYCTLQGAVSNSETAFWNNAADHALGIMQAIPNAAGTEAIMESTPNGVGNYFHQQWQLAESGVSDFIPIFIPWSWQEEYAKPIVDVFNRTIEEDELKELYDLTDEQLNWRRSKIIELSVNGADGVSAFKQEYSLNAIEAFRMTGEDSFITSDIVMKARKAELEKYGPLLLGVDPARFGDDRTAIIRRQGRVAYGLETYVKKDTMEIAGIVKTIIDNEKPYRVFVDVGGLGAGVVDRLQELCGRDIIVAVNAGSSPFDARKYLNKRAEMWAMCKEWLLDEGGADIPESDELHSDLCGIRYKVDSNSRLVMEQKADMKRRGVRSSDCSDSLCLTFAMPGSYYVNKRSKILDKLADNFNQRLAAKDYLR